MLGVGLGAIGSLISESQAAEERLWAGMCNKVFYSYLRRRWKYDENNISDAEKDASAILSRFFFSSGARGSYFRNSLSKYWWVGKMTYDENSEDPFFALKAIGSSDLNSKITEIFYNNTFTSNAEILKAITDALPREEITKITVDKINSLLKGKESVLSIVEDDYDEDEEPEVIPLNAPEVVETLSFDFDYEEPVYVCKGSRVTVYIEDLDKEKLFIIPKDKERSEMMLVETYLLGKSVGDRFTLARHEYIVRRIE